MVTSVPWERERDITENSPLWDIRFISEVGGGPARLRGKADVWA